eukprot:1339871-Rhodomonas_salina.2
MRGGPCVQQTLHPHPHPAPAPQPPAPHNPHALSHDLFLSFFAHQSAAQGACTREAGASGCTRRRMLVQRGNHCTSGGTRAGVLVQGWYERGNARKSGCMRGGCLYKWLYEEGNAGTRVCTRAGMLVQSCLLYTSPSPRDRG